MANLDDLFSKRDKKKKTTTKSKFSTLDANEFAKQLEATSSSRADDDLDYPQDGSDRFLDTKDAKDTLDEEWKVSWAELRCGQSSLLFFGQGLTR